MDFIGPAISAAGSLLGGVLSRKGQGDANDQNAQLQREFAQNGIRWKVEDAKAAGLHPLYAIGGAGATFTPSAQNVMSDMGQSVARAASAFSSVGEQELRAANIKALEASATKDLAAAQAFSSEAARNNQAQTPPVAQSFPVSGVPGYGSFDTEVYVDGQVPQVLSGASPAHGIVSSELAPIGPAYLSPNKPLPMFQRFAGTSGEVMLPTPEASEALESMENMIIQAYVASANYAHYKGEKLNELRSFVRSRLWSDPIGALSDGVKGFLDKHRRP